MKKTFLTGLAILMPVVLTILILAFLVDVLTDPFLNFVSKIIIRKLNIQSPQLITFLARSGILIFLFFSITLLGFLGRLFFIRWILALTNKILSKTPIIKPIYKTTKDIVHAFFQKDSKAFRYPTMVSFPSEKSYSIGFVTGQVPSACQKKLNKKLNPVFVPTAPQPISGFMLFIMDDKKFDIDMTNEQAVKMTVSCGVIIPEKKK